MTSRPPASSPAAPPPTLIAAYTPIARLRGGPGGNVVTMRASAAGATIAPPAPCTTRAASSHAWEVANPPAREAAENSSRPVTNIRRRPSRSPARPPSSSSPPNARAYALTTHSRPAPENPRARWICGRATLTMVESSTTINCAVAMTSSARPRWRPPSRALAAARPAPVTDCTCDMAVLSGVRGRDAGVRGTDVVVALEHGAGIVHAIDGADPAASLSSCARSEFCLVGPDAAGRRATACEVARHGSARRMRSGRSAQDEGRGCPPPG